MAENQFPVDEFDQLAASRKVRGAHRRKESNARWWIALVAVLVCAPLLGWGIVHFVGDDGRSPAATATATPDEQVPTDQPGETTAPEEGSPAEEVPAEEVPAEVPAEPAPVNYELPIEVYNASNISGYAASNQETLWSVGFSTVSTGNYSTLDPQTSQVFYPSEDYASTANEVALALGIPQDADHVVMGGDAEGRDVIVVVLAGELG